MYLHVLCLYFLAQTSAIRRGTGPSLPHFARMCGKYTSAGLGVRVRELPERVISHTGTIITPSRRHMGVHGGRMVATC
jgi:hypothetical protein